MAWDESGNPPGSLYRLAPDGTVTELFGDVGLSNGLDWTDDRRLFYYADSTSGRVDLFDTDPDTGALSGRRPFVSPPPTAIPTASPSTPKAASGWLSGAPARYAAYTPDGRLDTVIRLPARQVTSAAFGGPDLGTLYITTAWEGLTPAERPSSPTPATSSPAPPASPAARRSCSRGDPGVRSPAVDSRTAPSPLAVLLEQYQPGGRGRDGRPAPSAGPGPDRR